jgi:hypothetical protein
MMTFSVAKASGRVLEALVRMSWSRETAQIHPHPTYHRHPPSTKRSTTAKFASLSDKATLPAMENSRFNTMQHIPQLLVESSAMLSEGARKSFGRSTNYTADDTTGFTNTRPTRLTTVQDASA